MEHNFCIGESVFIFSETLNEVIPCKISGFSGEQRSRIKASQKTSDGIIVHIVSWFYVFRDRDPAELIAEEYRSMRNPSSFSDYYAGITVHLRQDNSLVVDEEGNPYIYQIIRVNHSKQKVTLIDTQGDNVGEFHYSDVEFASYDPIFRPSDYHAGQLVSWIEGDDVYEGVIISLTKHRALVTDIKKLLPLDKKKYLPYYKIQSDNLYNKILTYVIGDEIDSE